MADRQLTEHFSLSEFKLPDGAPASVEVKCEHLAVILEQVRGLFGQPVVITDSYRPPEHNAAVGGVPDSYHLFSGDQSAVDFFVENTATDTVFYASLMVQIMSLVDKLILEYRSPESLAAKDVRGAVIHLQTNGSPRRLAYYGCTAGQSAYTQVDVPKLA